MPDDKPLSREEQKALFAEWREDYAAAKARDQGEPIPTPSTLRSRLEKALFGDQKPQEQEHESSLEKELER